MNKIVMDNPVLIVEQKSTVLLVLASLFVLLSVFDNTAVLGGIPMLRNPAALAALLLVLSFFVYTVKSLRITEAAQWWALGFLVLTLIVELMRILDEGSLASGWLFRYLQWVQVLVLFFILLDIAKDPRAFHYIGISFLLAIVYISFSALLMPDGFAVEGGQRLGYDGENLNRQAYWYAMATIALVWWLIERWPRLDFLSVLLFFMAGFEFYCLLRSGSRAAFLGMLLGFLCLVVFGFRKDKLSAYLTLLPIMMLASLWVLLRNDFVLERIWNAWNGTQDGMRLGIFDAAWSLFLERPLLGYGMEFADVLGAKLGLSVGLASHNSFLRILLNFGMLAGIIWVCMIASILWQCWRGRGGAVSVLFLSLMVLSIVYGTFDELQFNKFFWVMMALASQAPLYSMFHAGYRLEVHNATTA